MARLVLLLCIAAYACGVPARPSLDELAGRVQQGDAEAVELLLGHLGRGGDPSERARVYGILLKVPAGATAPLVEALDAADPVRREHALALAANLRLEGAADAALRALRDRTFARRYVAAWTLGELGATSAATDLVEVLAQGDQLAAREAARALVKLGPEAVPALLAALPRQEPVAAGYAVRSLGELGDARAAPALLTILEQPLTPPELRADTAWALGKLGNPAAGEALLPWLGDPAWRVRLEVCRALGLLQVAAADLELDRLRRADPVPAVREWAARSLALLRGAPQTFQDSRGEERAPDNLYR